MPNQSDSESLNSMDLVPQEFTKPEEDSIVSRINSRYSVGESVSNSARLTKTRTETARSLYDLGVGSSAPMPDITAPPVKNPVFPEEYTLETETGLVPVQTLASLGRVKTIVSSLADEEVSEKLEKLDPEIEFVTFQLNDPENPHNWSMAWKWWYTFVYSWAVISAAYGSSSLVSLLVHCSGLHCQSKLVEDPFTSSVSSCTPYSTFLSHCLPTSEVFWCVVSFLVSLLLLH